MKKKCTILLAAGLALTVLTACEKTPDEVIVKEKNKNNMGNYETSESTGKSIRQQVGAPEEYKNKISFQDGKLVIDTDAQVVIPEAESVNTIAVKAKEINQQLLDQVTKAFFDDNPIYQGQSYYEMTKEQIQEKLTLYKKYASEGNLDPYGWGTKENGDYVFDIYGQIASYEQSYDTAPEKIEKKKVTPAFGLEYVYEDGQVDKNEDYFNGVAETEQGNYDYYISKMGNALGEESKEINFKIRKIGENADTQMREWRPGEYDRRSEHPLIQEEKLEEYTGISYEDAEKIAKEKVEKLNLEGMELAGWEYSMCGISDDGIKKEEDIVDVGYEFYFERKLNGIPVTYTMEYGGGLQSMESTEVPWGYEVLKIIVGEDGIQKAEFLNPYEIGDIQKENVALMDFDSIIKIYEQMMEVSNSDMTEFEKQRTYHIKKITFGYSRIYDPKADNGSGVLVPVWDFFGGLDVESEEYSEKNSGDYSTQSFMTINAVDGTIIDRGLGY